MIIERKNFITNTSALILVIISYYMPQSIYKQIVASASVFALAGAATNWLAIYMLFEKIPYLYGSGIIPTQFGSFKIGIEKLVMGQFFTNDTLGRYLKSDELSGDKLWKIIGPKIDYDAVFGALTQGVKESPMGGMLGMVGGDDMLNSLKPSIVPKLEKEFSSIVKNMSLDGDEKSDDYLQRIRAQIHSVVKLRLDELTPQMVKEIIQEMIRAHLGWLVVWGGIFGGLLGIIAEGLKII